MAESTTGGEWSKKANALKASKGNADPRPLTQQGEKISWAKLDNTERPSGDWR